MKHLLFVTALFAATLTAQAEMDFTSFGQLAVQEGGRKKPFDTFARETVQRVTGKKSFNNQDPIQTVLSLAFAKDETEWMQAKIIRLGYEPLKKRIGVNITDNYFSYDQLVANPKLKQLIDDLRKPKQMMANPTVKTKDPLEEEIKTLIGRLNEVVGLSGATTLTMIPHPNNPEAAWVSPVDGDKLNSLWPDKASEIRKGFIGMGRAFQAGDSAAFSQASREFADTLRKLSPNVYPAATSLQWEISYNHLRPFGLAWKLFLVSLLVMGSTFSMKNRAPYWIAIGFFVLGLGLQIAGFAYRCIIADRPPVTNMYESVIWVSFGAALFALIFEMIYRSRYFAMAASGAIVIALMLADLFPNVLDPSIQPLTPVLRDNFWLTVHVLTITLGYAAFLLTFALGHISLCFHLFRPSSRATLDSLTEYVYRAMQVGVLLLAAGTGLGGVWANYSWGRFWGWDPKETWALIALLSYLVVLHGRFSGWLTNFSLNVAAVACFNSVLMAWYGVNFVLGTGLHSYGFGSGGLGYVVSFVIADLAFVAFAAWRYKASLHDNRSTPSTGHTATARV